MLAGKAHESRQCVADEHYVPTTLAAHGLDNEVLTEGSCAGCIKVACRSGGHVDSTSAEQPALMVSPVVCWSGTSRASMSSTIVGSGWCRSLSCLLLCCRRTARDKARMQSGGQASGARTPTRLRKCRSRSSGVPIHLLAGVSRLWSTTVAASVRHEQDGQPTLPCNAGNGWCGSARGRPATMRGPCSLQTPCFGDCIMPLAVTVQMHVVKHLQAGHAAFCERTCSLRTGTVTVSRA